MTGPTYQPDVHQTMTDPTTLFFTHPSDDEPSSVTNAIHKVNAGDDDNDVFRWVVQQLRRRASSILAGFPKLHGRMQPDDLVNEFTQRLLEKIGPANVQNRDHFFGLACMNFRWILRDMAKRSRTALITTSVAEAREQTQSLADFVEILEFVENNLDESDRRLLELRIELGLKWREVADLLEMPIATASDRLDRVIVRIRNKFGIELT